MFVKRKGALTLDSIINFMLFILIFGLTLFENNPSFISEVVQLSAIGFVSLYFIRVLVLGRIKVNIISFLALLFMIITFFVKDWSTGFWTSIGLPFQTAISVAIVTCLFVCLTDYLDSSEKREKVLKYFIWSCISLILLLIVILGSDIFKGLRGTNTEALLLNYGINANGVGTSLSFGLIFCIYFLDKYRKHSTFIFTIIIFLFALLSGSRKVFLYIGISMSIYFIFRTGRAKVRKFIMVLLVILLGVFMTLNVPFLFDVIGYRLAAVLELFLGEEISEGSLRTRMYMIELGYKLFAENPIFGSGLNSFAVNYHIETNQDATFSHNNYIELLVSVGIVGTIIYYMKNFFIIKRLILLPRDKMNIILLSMVIAIMCAEVAAITYYYKLFYVLLALPASVVLHEYKRNRTSNFKK